MTIAPISPAALATELATDARTTRKFLRSITPADDRPGKGARWAIPADKRSIAAIKKQFNAWSEANAARATTDAPPADPDADDNATAADIDAPDAD